MAKRTKIPENEWSYLFDITNLDHKVLRLTISPDDEQRENLIKRLNIQSIEKLEATLDLELQPGGTTVFVSGHLHAEITQECVVSLDPVHAHIEEDFNAWFAEKSDTVSFAKAKRSMQTQKGHAEVEILEESDDPEPVIDDHIDLGELVTQYLSLAINPYPHAEGVEYQYSQEDSDSDEGASEHRRNPFEALKNWKKETK